MTRLVKFLILPKYFLKPVFIEFLTFFSSLVNLDTAEGVDSTLMQQVQLYNVALKQEDGEPVTEEEVMISFCVFRKLTSLFTQPLILLDFFTDFLFG